MRFVRTEQQQDMADAVASLLNSVDMTALANGWAAGETDQWWKLWRGLADMGATGVAVPENQGGLGLGAVELTACLEQLGYSGLPGPLVENLAVLPRLLADGPQGQQWCQRLVDGSALATVMVDGHVPYALDADQADAVFACHRRGVRLIERGTLTSQTSFDPARRLFAVEPGTGSKVSDVHGAAPGKAFDQGALGCAAQLLGIGRRLLDASRSYVTEREQFGQPVGQFQAVKHHLANALIKLEFARPVVHGACVSTESGASCAARDVSAAKVAAGDAAYNAARVALQVHGAIGYTVEHELHLWLTKATALRQAWGTPRWHRKRVAHCLATDPSTPVGGPATAG